MTFIFLRHLNFTNILKDINTNIVSLHNIEGVGLVTLYHSGEFRLSEMYHLLERLIDKLSTTTTRGRGRRGGPCTTDSHLQHKML